MTSKDKLGMSLDDIIQLDKKKKGNGTVISRGIRGRRGITVRGRGGPSTRGRGGPSTRGRGGPSTRDRGGPSTRDRGGPSTRDRGGPSIRDRRVTSPRGRGVRNFRGRGVTNSHLRGTNIRGQRRSISRDRGGINIRGRRGANIRAHGGRSQGIYRRGQRGLRGQFRGNQGMTNSFRSDHIIRQQAVQQKINRARSLKQLISKNSVSGAPDMLTVCIKNDFAVKRRRRSRSVPRTGSVNSFRRDSFVKRSNNNMYLNRQSLDRLNASMDSSSIVSPEGSVVTTISRPSRASSVGPNRNQRSSSVGRDEFRNRQTIIEQYLPVPTWQARSGLNMQLQKEIAAIQGKTYLPSTSPAGFANGGSSLSDFRPVPTLTTTTLNERFS